MTDLIVQLRAEVGAPGAQGRLAAGARSSEEVADEASGGGRRADQNAQELDRFLGRVDRAAVAGVPESEDGTKIGGDWFRDPACHSKHGSRSSARKAASAQIARIPFELSSHIAQVYFPR